MLQPGNTKICLVGDSLSGGGAERVHALLSVFFAGRGIAVHNVIVTDNVTYHFSGSLLNLGKLKNRHNGVFNKLKRLTVLRQYIKKEKFDYIIDFRMRKKPVQDWLIDKLIFTAPTVYTVHHYLIEGYMPVQPWFTRAIYGKSYGVISITQAIKQLIQQTHGLQNVTTIYNPVSLEYINSRLQEPHSTPGYKYIIAAGSMGGTLKQFDKLIEAYAQSVLPADDVKLMILGQGILKESYIQLAESKGLADKVIFKGFQDNPYVYMKDALFYVMSSRYEGLPMVLLESLASGTPVVSFDCFSGPSEIIIHKTNGLLVENQNTVKLTDAIDMLYQDKALYARCKENAVNSTAKFSLENIGREWLNYLKIDLN